MDRRESHGRFRVVRGMSYGGRPQMQAERPGGGQPHLCQLAASPTCVSRNAGARVPILSAGNFVASACAASVTTEPIVATKQQFSGQPDAYAIGSLSRRYRPESSLQTSTSGRIS